MKFLVLKYTPYKKDIKSFITQYAIRLGSKTYGTKSENLKKNRDDLNFKFVYGGYLQLPA